MHKVKNVLILNSFFFILAFGFAQTNSKVENKIERPKLVVGIIVDQMKYEYIYRYYSKFGNDGFKRLISEGFFCKNTHYNYVPTYTAPGHACIYTGATPSTNGIVGNEWFDRSTNDTIYCTEDKNVSTVGSNSRAGKMSPENLLTTTITDELKYANNFKSKVIAISLKDRGAILPGGHSADGAYWFDGKTGNWITSSFYRNDLPKWVRDFNSKKLSEKYLSQTWNTLLPIEQYTESTSDDNEYEEKFKGEERPVFPHDLPKMKGNDFELIRKTPFGNSLTTDLAIEALKSENLGKGNLTDFLAVSFSSSDYIGHQFGTNAIETEDCYLRLDADLARLLKVIDETIDKNNVLIFLTADHGAIPNVTYLKENKFPAETFSVKSLNENLRLVLKKEFGFDSIVSCILNNNIYFNHKFIKENKISLSDVTYVTIKFLSDTIGIAGAVSLQYVSENNYTGIYLNKLQNGFNNKRSGDVIYFHESGVVEYKKTGTTHGSGYNYDTHVPLIWCGWKIKQGNSLKQVITTDIAATLAALLHIEFPSGCTGKPIEEIVK